MTKPKRVRPPLQPPTSVALVTAQAVDMIAGQAYDDQGELYDEGGAVALVLLHRQQAGLPNPTPQELVAALDYVRANRE